jgi:hypothetical protein
VNASEERRFDHFVAIDWSGAVGPRQQGIAVAICALGSAAPTLVRAGHIWSRADVSEWLLHEMPQNTLAGFDLSPALPFTDQGAYFLGWDETPRDARALWALVDRICADDPHLAVSSFVDHPEACRYFRRHGGRTGDRFGSGRGRLRLVEQRQRAHRLSPSSCFNLVGPAQVGKSSLTGMRMLHRLGERLPVWPFDALPESGSLLVEIYTSLAARAAGVPNGRSKLRDGKALDAALAVLDSEVHLSLERYSDHATDALLTAAWLRKVADDSTLWNPPGLADVSATEGWTFGVR